MSRVGLFVIRKRGTDQFWVNSAEHGTGWVPGDAKQAFSKSELTRTLELMIGQGWFCDLEVMELHLAAQEGQSS